MGKSLLAFALIANLLMCPLRCLSGEWSTSTEEGTARSECCCCQPVNNCDDARSVGSPSKDDEPGHGCSCPHCICEGVTLSDRYDGSPLDDQAASEQLLIPTSLATRSGVSSQPAAVVDQFPPDVGGRDALIAFHVWLI